MHEDSLKVSQLFNDFVFNAVLNLNIDESNFTNVNNNKNDPILMTHILACLMLIIRLSWMTFIH